MYKTQGYLSTTTYNYTELWVSLAASLQRQGRGQGGSLWSYQLIVSTATEMLQHGDVTNQYIYSTSTKQINGMLFFKVIFTRNELVNLHLFL